MAVWVFAFLLLPDPLALTSRRHHCFSVLFRLGFAVKVGVLCPGIFRSYKHYRRHTDLAVCIDLHRARHCSARASSSRVPAKQYQ